MIVHCAGCGFFLLLAGGGGPGLDPPGRREREPGSISLSTITFAKSEFMERRMQPGHLERQVTATPLKVAWH